MCRVSEQFQIGLSRLHQDKQYAIQQNAHPSVIQCIEQLEMWFVLESNVFVKTEEMLLDYFDKKEMWKPIPVQVRQKVRDVSEYPTLDMKPCVPNEHVSQVYFVLQILEQLMIIYTNNILKIWTTHIPWESARYQRPRKWFLIDDHHIKHASKLRRKSNCDPKIAPSAKPKPQESHISEVVYKKDAPSSLHDLPPLLPRKKKRTLAEQAKHEAWKDKPRVLPSKNKRSLSYLLNQYERNNRRKMSERRLPKKNKYTIDAVTVNDRREEWDERVNPELKRTPLPSSMEMTEPESEAEDIHAWHCKDLSNPHQEMNVELFMLKIKQRQQLTNAPKITIVNDHVYSVVHGINDKIPYFETSHKCEQFQLCIDDSDYGVCYECHLPFVLEQRMQGKENEEYDKLPLWQQMTYDEYCTLPSKIHRKFEYPPSNPLNEWLLQIQALESTSIPPTVLKTVRMEMEKNNVSEEDLTKEDIRVYLRKNKLGNYYEHTMQILKAITGKQVKFEPEFLQQIRQMFDMIQEPWDRFKPHDRKSFFSYPYFFYKCCQLLQSEHIEQFKLLKSSALVNKHDQTWRLICEDLNWEFIPSY